MYAPVLLLPLAALLPVAVIVLLVLARTSQPSARLGPATAAARRHGVVAGVLAVVGGIGATAGTLALGSQSVLLVTGVFVACCFLVGGIGHTLVLALGELTWPRPEGTVRRVRLRRREIGDVVPRVLLVATRATWGVTAGLLATGLVVADVSGRALTVVSTADGTRTIVTASPFPGAFYGVPMLVCLGLLAITAEATLRLVVARPSVVDADETTDMVLRRASSHRVLRGALAATLLTIGPSVGVAANAGRLVVDDGRAYSLVLAAFALGAALTVAGLLLLAVPAPRVRAVHERPSPIQVPA